MPRLLELHAGWCGYAVPRELPMAIDRPAQHLLPMARIDQIHVLAGVGAEIEDGKPVEVRRVPRRVGHERTCRDELPAVGSNHADTAALRVLCVTVAIRETAG
jgi:hypothetical protein